MNAITENILREAADAFAFDRTTGEISRYGEGHINDTFVVWASDKCKRYIMQRINTDTFKNPKEFDGKRLPCYRFPAQGDSGKGR